MRAETEQVDHLAINLLKRGPLKCEDCPLAHLTASKVAKHIIEQSVQPSDAFEPYAQVMGECRDGLANASYPPSRQKICNHPQNTPDTIQSSDDLADTIISKLIVAQNV